jgi:hypothetical protein
MQTNKQTNKQEKQGIEKIYVYFIFRLKSVEMIIRLKEKEREKERKNLK